MQQIHVLHVVGEMNIGGIENMLMTIMPYMKSKGIFFDFAVHGKNIGFHEKKIEQLGGHVFHLPKFYGLNIIPYILAWYRVLKTNTDFKIIHGHMTSTASLYLLLAKMNGKIAIAHSHNTGHRGNLISKIIKRIMEYPLRYIGDYFFACSQAAAKFRFGKKILYNKKYYLWRNPVDTAKFCFSEEKRKRYREKLHVGGDLLIGHVGRMTYQKNHSYLLDVFYAYHKINSHSKLLLLGDGELRNEIEFKVKKMKLKNAVIIAGAVSNPEDYLSAMDVFLMPSRWEGFGVAVIEAQTNGLPCLVSEAFQDESCISNNMHKLSINEEPFVWAEKIAQLKRNVKDELPNNPYDIKLVAGEIEKLYSEMFVEK
ncbi:glycosyltransferase [Selenomonas ruminantium]|uniref:glycosyltransferase n=1 Tax=Selenomonas ruminantium TaxID=971 RepID=UPI0026EC756E|nr:glycosyltransferase [Selenomonas ruminantium]